MKHLIIRNEANGVNTFAIPGTDEIDFYILTTSAVTVTVPTNAKFAIFSATDDFYARWDGSDATIPGGNITDGTGSEINPIVRDVRGVSTFSIIAPTANTRVSIAFYV
jgi:hypothetical protein